MTRVPGLTPQLRGVLVLLVLEKIHASCAPSTRRLIRSPYSWPVGGMNRIYRGRQQKCLMLIVGGWTIVEAVFLYQPAKRATFFPRFAGCLGHIALVPRN
jgi:hypothetical protein